MPDVERRKRKRPDDLLGQIVTVRMPIGQWLHLLQWIGPLRSGRAPKDVIGATDLIRNALGGAMKDDAIRRARAKGSAEECSTERSRAPDRQPVAPVEGRAWETPATRTV